MKVLKVEEYFMYPQGICRIRKPACAGNGCAIFPTFNTISWLKSLILTRKASPKGAASFVIYKERNHKTSLI